MINSITTFQDQIQVFDSELEQLYARIAEIKAQKKAVVAKKRLADRAIAKLSAAIDGVLGLKGELGAEFNLRATEILGQVAKVIPFPTPNPNKEKELVDNPPKENDSNEFFAWQPTQNENVGSYFDIEKGKTHCTYIGINSKRKAEQIVVKLREYYSGLNVETRKATRLESPYELKIFGLSDADVRWLAEQDICDVENWKREHLDKGVNRLLSLEENIKRGSVSKGDRIYCPEERCEYRLDSWGSMRAEVTDNLGKSSYKYLNQLEIIPDQSEFLTAV